MIKQLSNFTDVLGEEIANSQPLSLPSSEVSEVENAYYKSTTKTVSRPPKRSGERGEFRSIEEIDPKYRHIFYYPYFNLVQSRVLDDALYTDKSMVVCAPTGSGKTVIFEMAIVQLLMELDDINWEGDFKIIYMAPVKSLCTERLTEWYPKFTRLGHLCIEVTGDTDVDFQRLEPYKIIITTPEKWDMLTRRWRDHRGLVELVKLFLIDEVHILNDGCRGPVLEAVVSRMKTVQESAQSAYRLEQLTKKYQNTEQHEADNDSKYSKGLGPKIRFIAVSATVGNPEDVADWLSSVDKSAVFYKFGDESRPVKLRRIVEGYPCPDGTSIFKFDIILNYKLWPIIQKYHDGKPTLIFCNTRKSVAMTAETLSKELTVSFNPEQKAKLVALAATIKNKKLQSLVLSGVGCHHAGLLYEERVNIENSFRKRELPILITTTTLAMGVNLPAHLVIIKNTQQYVNGAYQEYSISTVLQMVGRAGRPQFDTEATAVIMTTLKDKSRYQCLVGGSSPLQSFLHHRIPENVNSEIALGTVGDIAQCVQWLRSTFFYVRAGRDPRRYLGLAHDAPGSLITKKIEELCVKALNSLASSGLITMDEASCIESTEAGRLMSVFYLDLDTMKHMMKVKGPETLEQLLSLICESHELSDNHLRMDERRILNTLNRNNKTTTIRFPMKGKITTRQMKLSCIIQAVLGCLPIPDPSLHQEAMKIMRITERVSKCLVAYLTRPDFISSRPSYFPAILNSLVLNKCLNCHLWENTSFVSRQLKGIGPTFSTLLASAGKTSFMLLEESHPRDLERIMNKGPPAGNILRKQVALLPKYQLNATPIDTNTVSIKLLLLNQAHLSENIDNLTAGVNHKTYIVAGDSDNHLLLLTSFKDKDLIGMYDGSITYELSRQHKYEHKIIVHCVSSMFVGIDVQCEYVFKEIEPLNLKDDCVSFPPFEGELPETPKYIQPSIADIFKERKRKPNVDLTQSKEKKKRDCALIEKFKKLKNSFGVASEELKRDINETAELSTSLLHEFASGDPLNDQQNKNNTFGNKIKELETFTDLTLPYPDVDLENSEGAELDEDDPMCSEAFNEILNNIEKEIHKKSNIPPETTKPMKVVDFNKESNVKKVYSIEDSYQSKGGKKSFRAPVKNRKLMTIKSNYNFIDEIERKNINSDEEKEIPKSSHVFSDSIKTYVESFLLKKTSEHKNLTTSLHKIVPDDTNNIKPINLAQISDKNKDATLLLSEIPHSEKKHDNSQNEKPSTENACPNEIIALNEVPKYHNGGDNEIAGQYENNACIHERNKVNNNDLVIEIDNDEEDITQLATQKIMSLPSSPEIAKNNLEKDESDSEQNEMIPDVSKSIVPYNSWSTDNKNELDNEQAIPIECNASLQTKHNTNMNLIDDCNESTLIKTTLKNNVSRNNNITTENSPQSKHYSENNLSQQDHRHIKKYYFSRTNVDVSTKNLPDRKICVVKKVRVDLDVTEILTNTNPNEFKHQSTDLESAVSKEFENEFSNETPTISRNYLLPIANTKLNLNDDCIIETSDDILPRKDVNETSVIRDSRPDEISTKINEDDLNIKDITRTAGKTDVSSKQTSELLDVTQNQVVDQASSCNDTKPERDCSVANILQKYSKLLQCKTEKCVPDNEAIEEMSRKELLPEQKSFQRRSAIHRRYRISDIQSNKVPLPDGISKIISPCSKAQTEAISVKQFATNISPQEPIVYVNRNKGNDFQDRTILMSNMSDNQSATLPVQTAYDSDVTNELKSPTFMSSQLDPTVDLNLDVEMLDPKTLLQSVNQGNSDNIDLIIPPPPEFSEAMDQSPTNNMELTYSWNDINLSQDNVQENVENLACYDVTREFPNLTSTEHDFESNLFQQQAFKISKVYSDIEDISEYDVNNKTCYNDDIKPATEVETWTLSRNHNFKEPVSAVRSSSNVNFISQPESHYNSLQSFKFTRKTQMQRPSFSQQPVLKKKWPARLSRHFN